MHAQNCRPNSPRSGDHVTHPSRSFATNCPKPPPSPQSYICFFSLKCAYVLNPIGSIDAYRRPTSNPLMRLTIFGPLIIEDNDVQVSAPHPHKREYRSDSNVRMIRFKCHGLNRRTLTSGISLGILCDNIPPAPTLLVIKGDDHMLQSRSMFGVWGHLLHHAR